MFYSLYRVRSFKMVKKVKEGKKHEHSFIKTEVSKVLCGNSATATKRKASFEYSFADPSLEVIQKVRHRSTMPFCHHLPL